MQGISFHRTDGTAQNLNPLGFCEDSVACWNRPCGDLPRYVSTERCQDTLDQNTHRSKANVNNSSVQFCKFCEKRKQYFRFCSLGIIKNLGQENSSIAALLWLLWFSGLNDRSYKKHDIRLGTELTLCKASAFTEQTELHRT